MPPPQPPPPQARINLGDLKSQIAKRLGPERAQRYFSCLNRLLSQKLSKSEFNKLCLLTIGRENIPLHNQLVRSILKNAFQAKVPPPSASKPIGASGRNSPERRENGFMPSIAPVPTPSQPVWSNGHILPPSPRRCRSTVRDRRIKDRPSPLGPNGRAEVAATHPLLPPHDEAVIRENGDFAPCDLKRPMQQHQGGPAEQPAKRPRTEKPSPHNQASVHSKGLVEVVVAEDVKDAEQRDALNSARGPLRAPLGIPFCPASLGGARRSLPLSTSTASGSFLTNHDSGELCHTEALRKRMEAVAEAQGLEGVRIDCANLLNNGLDAYLKQLIRSSFQLVGARLGREPIEQPVSKQQPHSKPINGVWLGNHMRVQTSGGPSEGMLEPRNHCTISLQDFKVAMELNPQQLGEDWPLLLEKICLSSFEE